MIRVNAAEMGSIDFTIQGGDMESFYTVTIFQIDSLHTQGNVEK